MIGYDAATMEACAKVADEELAARRADLKRDLLDNFTRGQLNSTIRIAEAILALPIAPPAPLQVTADDVIERAARAICRCDEQDGGGPWDYHTAKYQEGYRERARAALAAALNPEGNAA